MSLYNSDTTALLFLNRS